MMARLNVFLVVAPWDELETDEGKTLKVQPQLGCPWPEDLALCDVIGVTWSHRGCPWPADLVLGDIEALGDVVGGTR